MQSQSPKENQNTIIEVPSIPTAKCYRKVLPPIYTILQFKLAPHIVIPAACRVEASRRRRKGWDPFIQLHLVSHLGGTAKLVWLCCYGYLISTNSDAKHRHPEASAEKSSPRQVSIRRRLYRRANRSLSYRTQAQAPHRFVLRYRFRSW